MKMVDWYKSGVIRYLIGKAIHHGHKDHIEFLQRTGKCSFTILATEKIKDIMILPDMGFLIKRGRHIGDWNYRIMFRHNDIILPFEIVDSISHAKYGGTRIEDILWESENKFASKKDTN